MEQNFEFEAQLSGALNSRLLTTGKEHGKELAAFPLPDQAGQQLGNYKKNYKKTVCTYWLRGMCMKGDQCGFLHQYDVEKMPICRNLLKFGECKELDCPYKHNTEEIKECNMYKLGFCIYGPTCRYKHKPLPGPPPKVEMVEAAKPKDFRDINSVVASANPGAPSGVMGFREHEALVSLGMGAGLRRGGGAGGPGRRHAPSRGWEPNASLLEDPLSEGAQAHKRQRGPAGAWGEGGGSRGGGAYGGANLQGPGAAGDTAEQQQQQQQQQQQYQQQQFQQHQQQPQQYGGAGGGGGMPGLFQQQVGAGSAAGAMPLPFLMPPLVPQPQPPLEQPQPPQQPQQPPAPQQQQQQQPQQQQIPAFNPAMLQWMMQGMPMQQHQQ